MTAPRVRTIFMGSDPIALPFLRSLRATVPAVELCAVYTQPDRPRGRGQKLLPGAIKQWAIAEGLPVRQPERCNADDEAWLEDEQIELVLVMAYGQLLRKGFLDQPRLGTYNLHTSLLPKYRGASPIHTALAQGESTTGISLMRLVPEMDAGPVVDQEPVTISAHTTAPALIEALSQACVPLIERALPGVLSGKAPVREQEPDAVTYCRRIFKEDALLDFRAPAAVLHRRIRAFQPWPGAVFSVRETPLKIGSADIVESPGSEPGTIHRPSESEVIVACGEEALRLTTLQRPGGRNLPASEFLRGFDLRADDQVAPHTMAPLVSRRPFPWKWRPGDIFEGIV